MRQILTEGDKLVLTAHLRPQDRVDSSDEGVLRIGGVHVAYIDWEAGNLQPGGRRVLRAVLRPTEGVEISIE